MVADLAVVGMLAFYLGVHPMSDRLNNFIQVFNEVVVCACVVSLVIFTDFIADPVDRYEYGYTLLYVVAASICVNVFILLASIVLALYGTIRKAILKRRYTKMMKERERLRVETNIVNMKYAQPKPLPDESKESIQCVNLSDIVEEEESDPSSFSSSQSESLQISEQSDNFYSSR